MKLILTGVLLGVVVLMVSSCAGVPTEPLSPGEVRILGMDFLDTSEVRKEVRYMIGIKFDAQGGPEITRACVQWTGYGLNCMKVLDYGNGLIRADVLTPSVPGSYAVKVYVYYVRNGKMEQSNVVTTPVEVKGEKKPMR